MPNTEDPFLVTIKNDIYQFNIWVKIIHSDTFKTEFAGVQRKPIERQKVSFFYLIIFTQNSFRQIKKDQIRSYSILLFSRQCI